MKDKDAPEIIFASDHGAFQGEYGMKDYGFHLTQEIMHVPLISSLCLDKNGKLDLPAGENPSQVNDLFSMKNIRNLITKRAVKKEDIVFSETLYPGQISNRTMQKHSFSKIAAMSERYKYIYQPWGMQGDNHSFEEMLFDRHYDKHEKINLANFDKEYRDNARSVKSIKKDVLMRYHSSHSYCLDPKNYFNNLESKIKKNEKTKITENFSVGTGWNEMSEIRQAFRQICSNVWNNTGRSSLIKF